MVVTEGILLLFAACGFFGALIGVLFGQVLVRPILVVQKGRAVRQRLRTSRYVDLPAKPVGAQREVPNLTPKVAHPVEEAVIDFTFPLPGHQDVFSDDVPTRPTRTEEERMTKPSAPQSEPPPPRPARAGRPHRAGYVTAGYIPPEGVRVLSRWPRIVGQMAAEPVTTAEPAPEVFMSPAELA